MSDLAQQAVRRFLKAASFSPEELATMATMDMLKPVARARQLERMGLSYDPEAPAIKSLVSKGLIKIRGGMSIVLDKKKAQEIMKSLPVPSKYKGDLENWSMQFKGKEASLVDQVIQRFAASYSAEELATLSVIDVLKPSYRAKQLERMGLSYGPEAPAIKSLVSKGIVKVRGNGSVVMDKKKAREAMKANPVPQKYKSELEGWTSQFKSKDKEASRADYY